MPSLSRPKLPRAASPAVDSWFIFEMPIRGVEHRRRVHRPRRPERVLVDGRVTGERVGVSQVGLGESTVRAHPGVLAPHLRLRRQVPVDLQVVVVAVEFPVLVLHVVARRVRTAHVRAGAAWQVGRPGRASWIFAAIGVDAASTGMRLPGNGVLPVPSAGLPRERVVDDLQAAVSVVCLAEVACPKRRGRHVEEALIGRLLILPFPRPEEEQLVLRERTAERRAGDVGAGRPSSRSRSTARRSSPGCCRTRTRTP